MASGERGFKGILLSSLFNKCKIPFQCSPQPVIFQTDGNEYFIEIIDGHGKFADDYNKNYNPERNQYKSINQNNDPDSNTSIDINESNTTESHNSSNLYTNDNSTQNFDQIIHAKTHSIKGTDDQNVLYKISRIIEYFKTACMALYDSPVTNISLTFGLLNTTIHLLDGDVTTSPNTYATFLFKSIPNGEETFVDYYVSSVFYDPKFDQIETETNTNYAESSSSFSINSTASTTFESHRTETSRIRKNKTISCYSNFPDCQKGRFKMPLLYVIFYFAKEYFPEVEAEKLYTLLKIRLMKTNSEKDVNVCIRCVHLYTNEKRDHQLDKKDKDYFYKKNIPSYEDDHLFINQPLPPEVKITKYKIRIRAKKAPVSIRRLMNGKPSHEKKDLDDKKRTLNNDEWNNYYDTLAMKKSKSTTCSFIHKRSSSLSIQKFKNAKKNIDVPHFSPSKSSSLKMAPNVYSNHHLLRDSWNTENIVKRFQLKSFSQNDPQYIQPRNCHILEI